MAANGFRAIAIGGAQRAALFGVLWWALAGGGVLFGVIALTGVVTASLALIPPSGHLVRPIALIAFMGFFLRESVIGGIQVAWRAFSFRPERHTRGTLFTYRTDLAEGSRRALLVGTMGLLPGTVTVEADGPDLRIHALDRALVDPSRIAALEHRISAL